jgi:hypothetical protein
MTVRSEIGGLTSAAETSLFCDGIAALKGCATQLAGEQGFRVSRFHRSRVSQELSEFRVLGFKTPGLKP